MARKVGGYGSDEFVKIVGPGYQQTGMESDVILRLIKQDVKTCPDPYIAVPSVHQLKDNNFLKFVNNRDAVMILFYERGDGGIVKIKNTFGAASTTPPCGPVDHAYASVDCAIDKGLCMSNGVLKTPQLAVFFKGHKLDTKDNLFPLDINAMNRFFVETSSKAL